MLGKSRLKVGASRAGALRRRLYIPRYGVRALRLSPDLRHRIEATALAGYPEAVCGLLIGREIVRAVEVWDAVPARKLATERVRDPYVVDPETFAAAARAAQADGGDIVGVWHSHPDRPAEPSESDLAGARESWSYLIVSVTASGVMVLRSWRLIDVDFREEVIIR